MIGAIYVITDSTAPMDVIDQARAAAMGGAWAVQFRDKDLSENKFRKIGQQLMKELAPFGVRLIINDRVEAAIEIGADGVHIGQSDGDPRIVRKQIGSDMMLGLSIESIEQCQVIPSESVDYVGVGPIRATTTKPNHAPPIGMEGLQAIVQAVPYPVIAIGGLGHGDANLLKKTGAQGMAIVSVVSRASDPQVATRSLFHEWNSL